MGPTITPADFAPAVFRIYGEGRARSIVASSVEELVRSVGDGHVSALEVLDIAPTVAKTADVLAADRQWQALVRTAAYRLAVPISDCYLTSHAGQFVLRLEFG